MVEEYDTEGTYYDEFINSLKDLQDLLSKNPFQALVDYDADELSDEPSLCGKLENVQNDVSGLKSIISTFINVISDCKDAVVTGENNVKSRNSSLPTADDVDVNRSSSGGSSGGSSSGGAAAGVAVSRSGSKSNSSSNNKVSDDKSSDSKEIKKIDVKDIIVDMLAPYGVTKDNFGSISKSNNGEYVITMKNTNSDGKWRANDIKEYHIKEGKVVGVLTGDDKYIKIEDGSFVIDETNNSVFSGVLTAGAGSAGTYFATQSNFNTDANKEIFKKFYPNATDEEFNNFCDNISKSGEEYSKVAEKIIEDNKDVINSLAEKTGYEFLTIEDNMLKIDCKGIATDLYAYESSKSGINFTDGISNEIVFNDSIANDLSEYIKNNYSIDIDVNSIFNDVTSATSDVSNTVTDTINGVANSNNISRDSISVENS